MTYLSGIPTGLLSGRSSGPLSGYGTWSGYPAFRDIDDVNVAKPWMHLASFGVNTPGPSDGNDNRSAQGKVTAPDVRPAYLFGPDEILRCLVANLGSFTCEIGGGGGGAGGRAAVSDAEGEAAAGTAAGTAAAAAEEATGNAAESEPGAALGPYREGRGHHVPAKRAFTGDPNYDIDAALAIPNSELAAQGIFHPQITGAQQSLYREFAKTGQPVTWDIVRSIETQALTRAGMSSESASVTVNKAISALQASGVSGPIRIPWGGN
jgi:hypothetical protein